MTKFKPRTRVKSVNSSLPKNKAIKGEEKNSITYKMKLRAILNKKTVE